MGSKGFCQEARSFLSAGGAIFLLLSLEAKWIDWADMECE